MRLLWEHSEPITLSPTVLTSWPSDAQAGLRFPFMVQLTVNMWENTTDLKISMLLCVSIWHGCHTRTIILPRGDWLELRWELGVFRSTWLYNVKSCTWLQKKQSGVSRAQRLRLKDRAQIQMEKQNNTRTQEKKKLNTKQFIRQDLRYRDQGMQALVISHPHLPRGPRVTKLPAGCCTSRIQWSAFLFH